VYTISAYLGAACGRQTCVRLSDFFEVFCWFVVGVPVPTIIFAQFVAVGLLHTEYYPVYCFIADFISLRTHLGILSSNLDISFATALSHA